MNTANNVTEIIDWISEHIESAQTNVEQALMNGALDIITDAKRNVSSDIGTLGNSIIPEIKRDLNSLRIAVGPTVYYGIMVEMGTAPHSTSTGSQDFVESMLRWGARHGFDEQETWGIIKHIRKFGTKPKPFLIPAYNAKIEKIKSDIDRAFKES